MSYRRCKGTAIPPLPQSHVYGIRIPHLRYLLVLFGFLFTNSYLCSQKKYRTMAADSAIFRRNELLLGDKTMEHIAQQRVIIFGVGGVGSWCAESLVRSGIRLLTIVDSDRVCVTNINRQLMATTKTVGKPGCSRPWVQHSSWTPHASR